MCVSVALISPVELADFEMTAESVIRGRNVSVTSKAAVLEIR